MNKVSSLRRDPQVAGSDGLADKAKSPTTCLGGRQAEPADRPKPITMSDEALRLLCRSPRLEFKRCQTLRHAARPVDQTTSLKNNRQDRRNRHLLNRPPTHNLQPRPACSTGSCDAFAAHSERHMSFVPGSIVGNPSDLNHSDFSFVCIYTLDKLHRCV